MTEFSLELARVPIGVRALYPTTRRFCREYLTDRAPAFTVTLTPEDIANEDLRSAREDARAGVPARRFGGEYLETLALYRRLAAPLLSRDIVVFHGAAVAVGGRAYLFTAPSGTGKTTHIRLWLKNIPGSFVLNGDKPLLRLPAGGPAQVCGTPWQGKENLGVNGILPLAGLCVLTRAEENTIRSLTFREGFTELLRQVHRPEEPGAMEKTVSLLGRLGTSVPLYLLGCDMRDEAALVSFRAMAGEEGK